MSVNVSQREGQKRAGFSKISFLKASFWLLSLSELENAVDGFVDNVGHKVSYP